MVIAISPEEPFEYVCECDRLLPAEKQTVWELRRFTVGEHSQLQNSITRVAGRDGSERTLYGDLNLKLLQAGLVGVRNFLDNTGAQVPFDTETKGVLGGRARKVPTETFLSRIPLALRDELARAILGQDANAVSEEEAKN
jgi:hypothetical protein